MKVLVTGGAGFIGLHTVETLVAQNYEVVVVDHLERDNRTLLDRRVSDYTMDISSEELPRIFATERPDAVIHLAAQVSVQRSLDSPWLDAKDNIAGTVNVLKQCVDYGVGKLVFSSSAAVYGNTTELPISERQLPRPLSFYGASKRMAEDYIRMFGEWCGLEYTILRYANVYGMRQSTKGESGVVASFVNQLLDDKRPCIYGNGEQTRDFVYVKDVARANVAALTRGSSETLNIGGGKRISVNELFDLIRDLSKSSETPEYRAAKEGDIHDSMLDNRRAISTLEWEPMYTISDGLSETIRYERDILESTLMPWK